jgi:hypothetical protein
MKVVLAFLAVAVLGLSATSASASSSFLSIRTAAAHASAWAVEICDLDNGCADSFVGNGSGTCNRLSRTAVDCAALFDDYSGITCFETARVTMSRYGSIAVRGLTRNIYCR